MRFVQTGTFQRVDSTTLEKVDVRFICASNRDPLAEVKAGRFQEDLYYRLHVIPILLPPLREGDADVMAIAREFLVDFSREEKKRFVDFSPEDEAVFQAYTWPGNVRQLQNVIRNVVVLNEGETVGKNIFPPPLNAVDPMVGALSVVPGKAASTLQTGAETPESIRPLWVIERDAIERAIEICGDNIPRAAAHLGISASTIYRKRLTWETQQPMAG